MLPTRLAVLKTYSDIAPSIRPTRTAKVPNEDEKNCTWMVLAKGSDGYVHLASPHADENGPTGSDTVEAPHVWYSLL